MHFVNAKGILSSENGMNLYRGCTTAVSIATAAASVTGLRMISRILKSNRMPPCCWNGH